MRAGRRAAFLWYLKIDLVRLAALLFLVQVQDPHVGSSASGEEQGLRKAGNVILALLPACARLQAGNRPAQAAGEGGRQSELCRTAQGEAGVLQIGGCWHLGT